MVQCGNDANAWPALRLEGIEILNALQIGLSIGSSLLGSLLAVWECYVIKHLPALTSSTQSIWSSSVHLYAPMEKQLIMPRSTIKANKTFIRDYILEGMCGLYSPDKS